MNIFWNLILIVALVSVATADAGVIEFPLKDLLESGDKNISNSIQFTVPVSGEFPCIAASVRIDLESDEETEVFAGFVASGDTKYADQITISSSGEYVFDLSNGIRFAQSLGLAELAFVIGDLSESKSSGSGIVSGESVLGQVTLVYGSLRHGGDETAPSDESVSQDFDDVQRRTVVDVTIAPNPFNPSVTIFLELPRASIVQLKVYDIGGRLVKQLHSGHLEKGRSEFVWDGRDSGGQQASSGIYLYQVVSGGELINGKMMLLK